MLQDRRNILQLIRRQHIRLNPRFQGRVQESSPRGTECGAAQLGDNGNLQVTIQRMQAAENGEKNDGEKLK